MAALAKDKQDDKMSFMYKPLCSTPKTKGPEKKKKERNQWFIVKNRKEYGNMIHRRQFTNGFQECL